MHPGSLWDLEFCLIYEVKPNLIHHGAEIQERGSLEAIFWSHVAHTVLNTQWSVFYFISTTGSGKVSGNFNVKLPDLGFLWKFRRAGKAGPIFPPGPEQRQPLLHQACFTHSCHSSLTQGAIWVHGPCHETLGVCAIKGNCSSDSQSRSKNKYPEEDR